MILQSASGSAPHRLEHSYDHRQHSELPLGSQEEGKYCNARIGCHTDGDQGGGGYRALSRPNTSAEGESDHLGQQRQQRPVVSSPSAVP